MNMQDRSENILVHTPFHKLLVLLDKTTNWPVWFIALVVALLSTAVASIWILLTAEPIVGATAGLILASLIFADAVLLYALPVRGISYGPWKAQLFALVVPRAVVAVALAPMAALVGPIRILGLLAIVQLLGSVFLIWGAIIEPFRLRVTNLNLETDRLVVNAPPMNILHISDIHLERLTRREAMLLDLIDQAKPDLILITGDYLNLSYVDDPLAQAQVKSLLSQIAAPNGVFAVLGSPTVDDREIIPHLFDDLPIRLLRDEWEAVDMGDGRQLVLLGLQCSHDLPIDRQRLNRVAKFAPNLVPQILLYHAPDLMPEAAQQGIELYLCGHTHGGQVRLPLIGAVWTSSHYGKRYEMGHYLQNQTNMYVSRGVGLEGLSAPRVRFLSPPEITLVTIRGTG